MPLLEKIDLILALLVFFTLIFNMFMFYYISRKHMKVMDKIILHREMTDDNFIFKTYRIVGYLVILYVERNRKALPEDIQKNIMKLDGKFRRPFLILIWNVVVLFISYFISIYLEKFYGVT